MIETPNPDGAPEILWQELAEFRSALRGFLHFSEEAATRVGLTPQQHQMMLQIAGAPHGTLTTIAYLAERLVLRHHSVVELSGRCEEAGLVIRKSDASDRRLAVLIVVMLRRACPLRPNLTAGTGGLAAAAARKAER